MPTTTRATRLMTLHALTFLHPGTGQTTSVVDLPVQREVHTGFPMIASSGLKGALREKAEREWKDSSQKVHVVFGPQGSEAAGALSLTDARILALPVRSLQKVFLWITCAMVLERLARDAKLAGVPLTDVPSGMRAETGNVIATESSGLQSPLVLEELRFDLDPDAAKQKKCGDLVTELKRFVPSLGEAGLDGRVISEIHTLLNGQYVQIGGNETVGQGWCQVALTAGQRS